nr:UDP-glycosyltransferase [Paris polyphylla]
MDGGNLHIVVFPWLAYGHMMPFLELSKSLAIRGHQISFISTTKNIKKLQPKVPQNLSQLIQFIPLLLPPTDGLPATAEATSDIPPNLVQYLKKAFDCLDRPFAQFLSSSSPKPDWIILDFASYWLPPLASKFNVPCVYFCIFFPSALVFVGPMLEVDNIGSVTAEQLIVPRKWITFPTNMAYHPYEAREAVEFFKSSNASGVSDAHRFLLTIKGCKAVAIRSCNEFMPQWLSLLRDLYKKAIIPVGMLLPSLAENEDSNTSELRVMEWLDQQSLSSVVYVAFGSEAKVSIELLHELALGLELSNFPFLWALRKSATDERENILPEGFEERTKNRGFVSMHWVPQLRVLAHNSVGGFLTHCGSSSIIESLHFGRPLILFPIFLDQGLNARVMEEEKIGFEVKRGEEDGSLRKEVVAKALRLIVIDVEGEPFRKNTKEMMRVLVEKKFHERYVDDLTRYLMDHKDCK